MNDSSNAEHNDTLELLDDIVNRAERLQDLLRAAALDPDDRKMPRLFTIAEVESLVGKSRPVIYKLEDDGIIPPVERKPTGYRYGYTLEHINKMRAHWGQLPYRAPDEDPIIISVQNLKGGVAKTTTAVHMAQDYAIKGYRVLVIDADPQASTTALFGYLPDFEIDEEDTILPFVTGESTSLEFCIRKTHWDQLDLIPANLNLQAVEMIQYAGGSKRDQLLRLREGIYDIANNYDIVVLDSPPNIGILSLSAMRACNAMLIPIPSLTLDIFSTISFMYALRDCVRDMQKAFGSFEYKFIRFVITRLDERVAQEADNAKLIDAVFQQLTLSSRFRNTSEISRASAIMSTVYDNDKAIGSKQARDRCVDILANVYHDLEKEILKCWPSQAQRLTQLDERRV